jgi:hypothetical protein
MKRFPIVGSLLLIPALAMFTMVGCTKSEPVAKKDGKAPVTDGHKDVEKLTEITTPTDGTIKGVVKFVGTPPPDEEQTAMKDHKDAAFCLSAPDYHSKNKQTWFVKDGKVENVVVALSAPKGKKFKVTDALKEPFKKAAVLDQPFCEFIPHVLGIYAGVQPLSIKNSAKVTHNTKIVGKKIEKDKTLQPGSSEEIPADQIEKEPNPIAVSCSMHTWMTAKLLTFDHPYFAVTGKDGSFEIKNVPTDEEVVINIWHEAPGWKKDVEKVSVKKGDTKAVELSISAQ